MSDLKIHSNTAWDIASHWSHVLASDTRTLAAAIDIALAAERERCARIAEKAFQNEIGDCVSLIIARDIRGNVE